MLLKWRVVILTILSLLNDFHFFIFWELFRENEKSSFHWNFFYRRLCPYNFLDFNVYSEYCWRNHYICIGYIWMDDNCGCSWSSCNNTGSVKLKCLEFNRWKPLDYKLRRWLVLLIRKFWNLFMMYAFWDKNLAISK